MIISLLSLSIAIACYAVSQLQQHGQLKWSKGSYGFWDEESHYRKYKKNWDKDPLGYDRYPAPNNWYYLFNKLKYKERFPLSSTLLVFLTDGYHLAQALFFIFLSLSFLPAYGWKVTLVVYALLHIVNFVVRKVLSK